MEPYSPSYLFSTPKAKLKTNNKYPTEEPTAMTDHWRSIVQQRRSRQLAAIPASWRLPPSATSSQSTLETIRSCGILTPEELQWTETTDISDLLSRLASREISSVQLTTAFCKRAAIAQQLIKCLTEIFFDKALARAKELDEHLARTGKVVGPLHGLPVSVKDRFDVEGFDTTVGTLASILPGVILEMGKYLLIDDIRMGGTRGQPRKKVQYNRADARVDGSRSLREDECPSVSYGLSQHVVSQKMA